MLFRSYRDNRLNPIHEGTHGIQGLDLLGRKVLGDGGQGLRVLAVRISETAASAAAVSAVGAAYAEDLAAAVNRVVEVTGQLASLGDPAKMTADSTTYLEALGHVAVAWIWLQQWLAADGKEGAFYEGKRAATAYFFSRELPKTGPMFDLLARADGLLLDVDPDVL